MTDAQKWLRYAAVLYGAVFLIHTGDHLRRGFDVVTTQVVVLGSAASIFQVAAIGLVLARHRLAPIVAFAVGFPDALGIASVHLLPHWSSLSDAFPGAHGAGVTGFSWFAGVAEIVGALAFGAAGANVLRQQRVSHQLA
jgi:hypothetical protein